MRNLILRVVVNGLALWAAAYLVSGITLTDDIGQVALVALVFGLVNAVLKPILMLLSIPFLILTLGLFALVVNAAMLMITAPPDPDPDPEARMNDRCYLLGRVEDREGRSLVRRLETPEGLLAELLTSRAFCFAGTESPHAVRGFAYGRDGFSRQDHVPHLVLGERAVHDHEALRLSAGDLLRLGVVDEIVEEPVGAAHRDPVAAVEAVRNRVLAAIDELSALPVDRLLAERYDKFRRMGTLFEDTSPLDGQGEPDADGAPEGTNAPAEAAPAEVGDVADEAKDAPQEG